MNEFENQLYREELNRTIEHVVGIDDLGGSTVMITGASGEVGGFLIDVLMQMNASTLARVSVIACGRDVEKLRQRFAHWIHGDDAKMLTFKHYDMLNDISDDMSELKSDYIIHAAGNAYPSAFVNNPEETVKGNVLGTARLMDFAAKHKCKKFLYVSSGEVYSVEDKIKDTFSGKIEELLGQTRGSGKEIEVVAESLCELVLQNVREFGPRSSYPLSKVAAETLCMSEVTDGTCCENGDPSSEAPQAQIACVVARLCHTFGPGAKETDDRAHAEFARKAADGEEIVLNSAGSQLRSYNYIVDSASGILSVLLKGENHEAYDICSPGNTVTIRELAGLFANAGGNEIIVKEPDEKQKALQSPISKQVLDSGKLEALGWSKAYELEDAVKNYVKIIRG